MIKCSGRRYAVGAAVTHDLARKTALSGQLTFSFKPAKGMLKKVLIKQAVQKF